MSHFPRLVAQGRRVVALQRGIRLNSRRMLGGRFSYFRGRCMPSAVKLVLGLTTLLTYHRQQRSL